MSWSSLLPDLSDSVDIIGKLAENLKKATEAGLSIYDAIQLQRLKASLTKTIGTMTNINSNKIKNIEDLSDYLDDNVFKLTWNEITKDWEAIADSLDKMLENIETSSNNSALVLGTGFENAAELKAVLNRQTQIYRKLSVMTEPQHDEDRVTARQVDEKLQSLLTKVFSLESSIERYLRKFAPALSGS
jgi:replicative DNA helicase